MERQPLISATLVAALGGATGALADCADEIAELTQVKAPGAATIGTGRR